MALEPRCVERGSAIIIVLITISLFGLLTIAFNQSSRSNISWLQDEGGKAEATQARDCDNMRTMAETRLKSRGCEGMISLASDGTNTNPNAPTDGSCSVYHPNGGGAKACIAVASGGGDCPPNPLPGDICPNGMVYAGLSPDGNVPMFTTPTDAGLFPLNNGNSSGLTPSHTPSLDTGEASTNILISMDADSSVPGVQPHLAAQYCADLSAFGKDDWYVPAVNELLVLYNNRVAIGNFNNGSYRTSRTLASNPNDANIIYFATGGWGQHAHKPETTHNVRCVRKD